MKPAYLHPIKTWTLSQTTAIVGGGVSRAWLQALQVRVLVLSLILTLTRG